MKKLILYFAKVIKHLFYDIIPEFYNINWHKHDFESSFDYYCLKPIIYLFSLVASFFDIQIVIYRILYILGFTKAVFIGVLKNEI